MSEEHCCADCGGPSRRHVIKGAAAVAAVGTLGLAASACAPKKTPLPTELTKVATVDEVPVGTGKSVMAGETPVLLAQPSAGQFIAYSSKCPHQGCVVGVDTENFLCPCHNSGFDFAEGIPQFGPAREPLTQLTCEVQGNDILVRG
ncbi:Rieske (2Fe-2S) protein [Micrococcoides hystricis]|uniref:Cytochrome bc1 complex Rieske iron-sulfur subunit n=1 Tax=Micrococcoides hystricis TaxID=1572761 RepID=A0ABV6P8F2_9MICC